MTAATHDYEDKILKLLAKAERTTPEEAEALTAMAERLMIKLGIDQAMLNAKRASAGGKVDEKIIETKIVITGIYQAALLSMGHAVVMALGSLRSFQMKGWDGKSSSLHIVGYEGDVKQAELLYNSLTLQAVVALRKWWQGVEYKEVMTGMEKFKERRDFVFGFGTGAATRIRNARRDIISETTGNGMELVLVDRKKSVDDYISSKYRLGRARGGVTRGNGDGRSAGQSAGMNANTGGTAVGGGSRGALGR